MTTNIDTSSTLILDAFRQAGKRRAAIWSETGQWLRSDQESSSYKEIDGLEALMYNLAYKVQTLKLAHIIPTLYEQGNSVLASDIIRDFRLPTVRCAVLEDLGVLEEGNPKILHQALCEWDQIQSERERVHHLQSLAPKLSQALICEAVSMIRLWKQPFSQFQGFVILHPFCADEKRRTAICEEALHAAEKIADPQQYAEAQLVLAQLLEGEALDVALQNIRDAVGQIASQEIRADILYRVVQIINKYMRANQPQLDAVKHLAATWVVANQILHDSVCRAEILATIAPLKLNTSSAIPLADPLSLRPAIDQLQAIVQPNQWVQIMEELLPLLVIHQHELYVDQGYSLWSDESEDTIHQCEIVYLFIKHLPEAIAREILELVRRLPTVILRAAALTAILPRLRHHEIDRALVFIGLLPPDLQSKIFAQNAHNIPGKYVAITKKHLASLPHTKDQIEALRVLSQREVCGP